MNERVVIAQANVASPQGSSSPKIVKVVKPQGDQAVTLDLGFDQNTKLDMSSVANEKMTLVHVGTKLIILFDNRSTVTVEPFFDSTGKPLSNFNVDLGAGRDVSGEQFASIFPITDDQSVLPAAGDGNGAASGANFHDSSVDPLNTGNPLDLLGQEELGNFVITTETTPVAAVDLFPTQVAGARVRGIVEEEELSPFLENTAAGQGNEDESSFPGGDADIPSDHTITTLHVKGSLAGLVTGGDGTLTFSILDVTSDGNPANDFVKDTAGNNVKSLGEDVKYTVFSSAAGETTIEAWAGTRHVFTLHVLANGDYEFTLNDQIDHPTLNGVVGDNLENLLDINLTTLIHAVDGDGDPVTLTGDAFAVTVIDDIPVATGEVVTRIVTENDIATPWSRGTSPDDGSADGSATGDPSQVFGGPAYIFGSLAGTVSIGADAYPQGGEQQPHIFGFADNAVEYMTSLGLFSKQSVQPASENGLKLFYTTSTSGNWVILTGYEPDPNFGPNEVGNTGNPVFELRVDQTTGAYEFRLYDELMHQNSSDPADDFALRSDQPGGFTLIDGINFGHIITATDYDGDTITLDGKFIVKVQDDHPVAQIRLNGNESLIHDETPGIDGADDVTFGQLSAGAQAAFGGLENKGDDPDVTPNNHTDAIGYARDGDAIVIDTSVIGADAPAATRVFSLELQSGFTSVDSGLKTTEGLHIWLVKEGDLIVGRADLDGNGSVSKLTDPAAFAIYLGQNGQISVAQYLSIQHDDRGDSDESNDNGTNWNDASPGDNHPVQQTLDDKIFAKITVTDSDGDVSSASVDIGSRIVFQDDGPEISHLKLKSGVDVVHDETPGVDPGSDDSAADLSGLFANVSGLKGEDPHVPPASGPIGYAQSTGAIVQFSVDYGADGPKAEGALKYALQLDHNNIDSGLKTTEGRSIYLFQDGNYIVGRYEVGGDGRPGNDGDTSNEFAAFALTIDPSTGQISLVQYVSLYHPDAGSTAAEYNDTIDIKDGVLFVAVTATDGDGDFDTDLVDIGTRIEFKDDGPKMVAGTISVEVDEDGLTLASGGAGNPDAGRPGETGPTSASATFTGAIGTLNALVNFGADGAHATNAFSLKTQSPIDSGLTSTDNGIAQHVLISSNGMTLRGYVESGNGIGYSNGDREIFTLVVNDDGSYVFTLKDHVDHPAGSGENLLGTSIDLSKYIIARDGDGDTVTFGPGAFTIQIRDDIPVVGAAPTNLVTNGDFVEGNSWSPPAFWGSLAPQGTVPGWTIAGDPSDLPVNGIQFERQSDGFHGLFSSTHNGMIDLGASPGNYQLSQTFAAPNHTLVGGQTYVIQFEAGAPFPGTALLEVYWGNTKIGVIDTTVSSGMLDKYAFTVTASNTPSDNTLSFHEIGTGHASLLPGELQDEGYHGTYIANVQVLAVNAVVDEDGLNNANAHGIGDGNQIGDATSNSASVTSALNIQWGADNGDANDVGGKQDGVDGVSGLIGRSLTFTDTNVTVGGTSALKSNGDVVKFALVDEGTRLVGYVDSGAAGYQVSDRLVFEVSLSDDASGSFKFTLHDNLDHADGGNENDIALTFNYTATDSDGDSVSSSFIVGVDDDMPVVLVNQSTAPTPAGLLLNLDETVNPDHDNIQNGGDHYNPAEVAGADHNGDLDDVSNGVGGFNAAPVLLTNPANATNPSASEAIGHLETAAGAVAGLFSVSSNYGADGAGTTTAALSFTLTGGQILTNLKVTALDNTVLEGTSDGYRTIVLYQSGNTIEGRIAGDGIAGGGDELVAFRISILNANDPANAKIAVDQFLPIDHGGSEDPSVLDEAISLLIAGNGSLGLTQTVTITDDDGDTATSSATVSLISNESSFISFDDDGPAPPVLTSNALSNGLFFDGFTSNSPEWGTGSGVATVNAGGWSIGGSQLERVGDGYRGVHSPTNSLIVDLEASPGNLTLSQIVSGLTVGEKYRLSFEIGEADHNSGDFGDAKVEVLWNNVVVGTFDPHTGVMQTISLDIVPTGTSGTLTFREIGTAGDNTGTYLANVKFVDAIIIDETLGIDNDSDDTAANTGIAALFANVANPGADPGMGSPQYATNGKAVVKVGTPDLGMDGPASSDAVHYSFVSVNGTDSGLTTTDGKIIKLFQSEDGLIVGRYDANNGAVDASDPAAFALVIDPVTGVVSVAQYVSLHHPDVTSFDEGISLAAGSVSVKVTLTDGDGDKVSSALDVSNLVIFEDDGPTVAGINLIVNGSFELGHNLVGDNWDIFNSIAGWTMGADGAPFEIQHGNVAGQTAHTGSSKVELDSDPFGYPAADQGGTDKNPTSITNATIQQAVATEAGQTYELTFWYAPRLDDTSKLGANGDSNNFKIHWGNDVINVDLTGASAGWHQYTVLLTATGSSTIVGFSGAGTANAYGAFIDDVSLSAVGVVDEDGLVPYGNHDTQPGDVQGNATSTTGALGINWGADDEDAGVDVVNLDGSFVQDHGLGGLTGRSVAFANATVNVAGVSGDLKSHGEIVHYALSADNTKLIGYVENGAANNGYQDTDRVVFEVTLSDEDAGKYNFILKGQLDHAPGDAENDIKLTFNFTATDGDGDNANGTFQVLVDDDMPVVIANGFVSGAVDEDALTGVSVGNPDSGRSGETSGTNQAAYHSDVNNSLNALVHFGADGPGSTAFKLVTQADAKSWIAGLNLESKGVEIDDAAISGNTVTAKAHDGRSVFSLTVNADGSWTFQLIDQIDHPLINDPSTPEAEKAFEDELSISLGGLIVAIDGDGDAVPLTNANFQIVVRDDIPYFGAIDPQTDTQVGSVVHGSFNFHVGADEPGHFNVIAPTIEGVTVTTSTDAGVITVTGTFDDSGEPYYVLTVNPNGTYTFTLDNLPITASPLPFVNLKGGFGPTPAKDFGSVTFIADAGHSVNGSGQGIGIDSDNFGNGEHLTVQFDNPMTKTDLHFMQTGSGDVTISWKAIDSATGHYETGTLTIPQSEAGAGSYLIDILANNATTDGNPLTTDISHFDKLELTATSAHSGEVKIQGIGGTQLVAGADVGPFDFTLVGSDYDNDQASATIHIDYVPSDANTLPTLTVQDGSVSEAGLPARTIAAINEPAGSDSAGDSEKTTGQISYGAADGPGVVTIDGVQVTSVGQQFVHAGIGTLTITSIGAGTIDYSYTLMDNTSGDDTFDRFAVVVTDSNNDTTADFLDINIIDDAPIASNNTASVRESSGPTNVVLVIDTSGSVDGTALNIEKAAAINLLNAGINGGQVLVVDFNDDTHNSGWVSVANAITYINNLHSGGGTDYDNALAGVTSFFNSHATPSASETVVYFLSDGDPNSGTGIGSSDQTAWEQFLSNNNIGTVYGVKVGSTNPDNDIAPIAFPNDAVNNIGIGSNTNALVGTITSSVHTVSGNVLTDGTADKFGADGGRILSISVGGTTYTWNGASKIDPGTPAVSGDDISGTSITNVITPNGGKLTFNFANGSWTYTAPSNIPVTTSDVFTYVLVDGDGDPSNSATLTVTVNATDDAPIITSNGGGTTASISVAENTTAVTTVTSTDIDGPNPTYSIIGGSDSGKFTIDASTGALSFVAAPNYESPSDSNTNNSYVVQVQVADGAGGTDTQTITVNVTNVNEAPVLAPDASEVTYIENAAALKLIPGATVTDPDNPSNFSGGSVDVSLTNAVAGDQLTIVTGGTLTLTNGNATVRINGTSVGTVSGYGTTHLVITFDSDASDANVEAIIKAIAFSSTSQNPTSADRTATIVFDDGDNIGSGPALSDTSTITIHVTPQNDTPGIPADSNAPSGGSVAEGAANGTAVGITALSTDPDGDVISYTLTNDAGGRFAIDSSTGIVTVANSALLNYEGATSHTITVKATDPSGAFSTQNFTVSVTDVAPTAPTDSDSVTGGSVSEDAANGTAVGITAASTDVNGGAVIYSLTDNAGGRFAINSSTGIVTVANGALLNFEGATSHTIIVKAVDPSGASSTQTFTIDVTDVAPTAPTDSNGVTGGSVAEGAANGTAVGITAASTDVHGGTVTYSLMDDAGGRFAINGSTGVVTVANGTLLDFETATSHTITVKAADANGLFSTQTFTIGVTDVAPSVPTDSNGVTGGSVAEGAANGTAVGITAASTDVNGGAVTYSLTNNAGGRFAIDSSTGVVTVANGALLDFETTTSHTITVKAADPSGVFSTQNFTIGVTDANDAPVAVADQVITNIIDGSQIIIPKAVLLANDTDPDSDPLSFGNVTNPVNGVAGLSGGNVTFTPPAATQPINANFASNENGFVYADGRFGGGEPASGTRVTNAPGSNTALRVLLGGENNTPTTNMTGGWRSTFNLTTAALVTITFDYYLTLSSGTDLGDDGQVLMAVDGTTHGTGSDSYVAKLAGSNSGSNDATTGWKTYTITLDLGVGSHTLDLGALMTSKDSSSETATAYFDNVHVDIPGSFHYTVSDGSLTSDGLVTITGQSGSTITGTSASEILISGSGSDTLNGNGGNDTFIGNGGNDILNGGTGNDTYRFGLADGNDTINDSGGSDRIQIMAESQALTSLNFSEGSSDNLVIQFNGQQITVTDHFNGSSEEIEKISFDGATIGGYALGAGDYVISTDGSGGRSVLTSANTILIDDSNGDILTGNSGNDLLFGNGGSDTLIGGGGSDLLVGGTGADHFRYTSASDGGTFANHAGADHILDFSSADGDSIDILLSQFGGTATGLQVGVAVTAAQFKADATDNFGSANERFHYNTDTHTLFYDSNGNSSGGIQAVLAVLDNAVNLQASNIHIVS